MVRNIFATLTRNVPDENDQSHTVLGVKGDCQFLMALRILFNETRHYRVLSSFFSATRRKEKREALTPAKCAQFNLT